MSREILQTNTTDVFDVNGKKIGVITDTYFRDTRPGREGEEIRIQQPLTTSTTSPATTRKKLTTAETALRVAKALGIETYAPPNTLDEVNKLRKEHGIA